MTISATLRPRALIGMVHVGALPGSPRGSASIGELACGAVGEANALAAAGFDAIILENMHDAPYVNAPHGPETVAAMTLVAVEVRRALPAMPLGIQILSTGEREALAVALVAGAQFIRCENFVFAHVADEGLLATAAAGPLLRYRRAIGAEHVRIYADVKKKHASHAVTSDVPLADAVEAAAFFGADGVIVTGAATGRPTDVADVEAARGATTLPVLVGSGVTPERASSLLRHADALIVGSWIKHGGVWSNAVDPSRARAMAEAVASARAEVASRGDG